MANTRKKRGRSKGGEVAVPTNEVTTIVEAGGIRPTDTQPEKKKRGRSKRKVGSEKEPVETAPEDGQLNVSEGVTEATATTILQGVTNSTEVGGVPPTDPPVSEVPNSDEGGVKDGELNISEEGVTEGTATTILQEVTDSTEVEGVPPTDPPMSEVPNDEGGVKTPTDATNPPNTTAAI
jgi:hypothetical protein